MSCEMIQPELIAYHFGTVDPGVRKNLEAHLPECGACLRRYLALKRDIELGEAEPAPSAAVRHRLRRSIHAELRSAGSLRPWHSWERPAAFGFAAAAMLVAALFVKNLSTGPGHAPRSLAGQLQVDAPRQ